MTKTTTEYGDSFMVFDREKFMADRDAEWTQKMAEASAADAASKVLDPASHAPDSGNAVAQKMSRDYDRQLKQRESYFPQDGMTKLANAAISLKDAPRSPAEYEERVAALISGWENMGYTAERKPGRPLKMSNAFPAGELDTEVLVVTDETGFPVIHELRAGMIFSGLVRAESAVQVAYREWKAEREASALTEMKLAAEREAAEEAAREAKERHATRPVTHREYEGYQAQAQARHEALEARLEALEALAEKTAAGVDVLLAEAVSHECLDGQGDDN